MLPCFPTENSWLLSRPRHGPACALCHPAKMLRVFHRDPALQAESHAATEIIVFSLKTKITGCVPVAVFKMGTLQEQVASILKNTHRLVQRLL